MSQRIAVVILSYNGEKFLDQFLPGVIQHSQIPGVTLWVADNGSTDGSATLLSQKFPSVKVLSLPSNDGYAGGYNNALNQIGADYYVLLNSDVEVTAGWLEPVIGKMEKDPSIAACQPKIKSFHQRDFFEYAGAAGGFIDRLGYPFCRGRIFDTIEKDEGQYNNDLEIFWASGACMFVRATVFHECNGFDNHFFAHMEEIDLCWRMKARGYKVTYCSDSTVYHVGGGTLQKSDSKKTFLNFRNNLWMLKKNMPEGEYETVLATRTKLDALAAFKNLLTMDMAGFDGIRKAHAEKKNIKSASSNHIAGLSSMSGVYLKSIVRQYYFSGKKRFDQLDAKYFTGAR
jgi:GT2 family glycosyltransferase